MDGFVGVFVVFLGTLTLTFILNLSCRKLYQIFERQQKFWKESFVAALSKPAICLIWILAAYYFIHTLDLKGYFIPFKNILPDILAISIVFCVSWFLFRWKSGVVSKLKIKIRRKELSWELGKIDVISKVLTMLIIFLSALFILEFSGRSFQTLLAFGGVGALAIAFASQEIIANFFGGLMIYVNQPFQVGDWITLPERNFEGHVEEIGWYMTRIRNFEKRPIYVPNSMFTKMVVVTPSRMSHRQIKEIFCLRNEDFLLLPEIIRKIKDVLEKDPHIDHRLSNLVHFIGLAEHGLNIQVSFYTLRTDNREFLDIKQEILFKIINLVLKSGAQFASPHYIVSLNKPN